jgi:hypothetical protein
MTTRASEQGRQDPPADHAGELALPRHQQPRIRGDHADGGPDRQQARSVQTYLTLVVVVE